MKQFKEIKRRPLTAHPDDHYLAVILSEVIGNEITPFATHIENTAGGNPAVLIEGHYFNRREDAEEDFEERW